MAKREATVPLNVAEFLRVTLQIAKQSEHIDVDAKARIGMVLAMYEVRRDEWLLTQGYTPKQIAGMAQSAALALANHIEDAANKTVEAGAVLTMPSEDELDMDGFECQFDDDND